MLRAAYLKMIWMMPHKTMPHSAENRKGPRKLRAHAYRYLKIQRTFHGARLALQLTDGPWLMPQCVWLTTHTHVKSLPLRVAWKLYAASPLTMAAVITTASSTISGAYTEHAAPTLTLRQNVCTTAQ